MSVVILPNVSSSWLRHPPPPPPVTDMSVVILPNVSSSWLRHPPPPRYVSCYLLLQICQLLSYPTLALPDNPHDIPMATGLREKRHPPITNCHRATIANQEHKPSVRTLWTEILCVCAMCLLNRPRSDCVASSLSPIELTLDNEHRFKY